MCARCGALFATQRATSCMRVRGCRHGWLAGRCASCRRRRGRSFVTTVHGLNSPGRYSAIMTRGERVICVSETVRAHVLRALAAHRPAATLRVIERGIDPAAFPRAPLADRAARARIAALHPQLGGDGRCC